MPEGRIALRCEAALVVIHDGVPVELVEPPSCLFELRTLTGTPVLFIDDCWFFVLLGFDPPILNDLENEFVHCGRDIGFLEMEFREMQRKFQCYVIVAIGMDGRTEGNPTPKHSLRDIHFST